MSQIIRSSGPPNVSSTMDIACSKEIRLRSYFRWKRWIDELAACLLLIPGLPMIGLLVVLIRWNSRGPGIYRQRRVGKDGRIFTMYKLRSMRIDAEAATGPVWCSAGSDPRVTRLGYWLRKLHLDELPQLFNVVRGEMSLIGPRPERPEFVQILAESLPEYLERLRVAPGITGLAQINLPPDTDLNSVRRKLILDLEYIETAGLSLDIRMFLCTFARMVGLKGDLAMRIMALKRRVNLPSFGASELPAESSSVVTPETIAATVNSHVPGGQSSDVAARDTRDPEDSGILAHASRG